MELIHALADTGQDGPDAYAECTCGMRTWGEDDMEAHEGFQQHRWRATGWYPR